MWFKDPEMTVLHRLDGPAIEMVNGLKYWFQDGKKHRLDGPAVEWVDGRVEYYIEGSRYSKTDFNRRVKELTRPPVKEMTMEELEKALGHAIKIIK